MYCHQCGAFTPEGSRFCRECGTKLLVVTAETATRKSRPTDLPQLDVQGKKPSPQLTLRHIYYQRLAEVLAADGFRMDPRLLQKEDAVKSMDDALKVGGAVASAVVGPLGAIYSPLLRTALKARALSGDELYNALAGIAALFSIIAVKYVLGTPFLFAVTEADGLDSAETGNRASTLCEAMYSLVRGSTRQVQANCLYVFFDAQRCLQTAPHILHNCYQRKMSIWWKTRVDVWPIVANVPTRELLYKKGGFAIQGFTMVPKEVLQRAFA